ncbi:MAG: DNA adenine methylase [Thermosynechococcaceae cyanobacterium]
MSTYYSPLRYPGGKNCIFPFMGQLFYENDLIGISYAEPYAGGAGLALRLLFEGYVEHVYLNDLDKSIFSFWVSILERTDEFCKWIEDVEVSVDMWDQYKAIQNNSENIDCFDIAKSTFFLNRTNVSGILKGGIIGGREQKGKYKLDVRFNKQDLINRIRKIASVKQNISVSNLDGLQFISKLNRKKEEVFIYLDPPYFIKGSKLYMNFYLNEDHKKLSRYVRKMKNRWMISYDKSDFILNLYKERKIAYKLSQSASNKVENEVLIFSSELDYLNSMKALKSPIHIL